MQEHKPWKFVMLEFSLYSSIENNKVLDEFERRLAEIGCKMDNYESTHKVFKKKNIQIRLIDDQKLCFYSPPDSNASRQCTIQQVDMCLMKGILANSPQNTIVNLIEDFFEFDFIKDVRVKGRRCRLEEAEIEQFQINETCIVRIYFRENEEGQREEFLAKREQKLWALSRLLPIKFYHIENAYLK